ncbi:hypothetical protein BG011_009189 [Mortierella polycephala]|uniref:Uncharacterized protein n=1 Tax=Mortierella polycephala TaxID=41804 RepID=A0A9P6QAZ3_9FUNG|nr:hypothetical protein BG011_009189 [Mortierella polycephala]
MFSAKLNALEESSLQLSSIDFSTPRLYSALLLDNLAVPIRDAKPYEQDLFTSTVAETIRRIKTKEGVDEFDTTIVHATAVNDICLDKPIQERLKLVTHAYADVLESISKIEAERAELEESKSGRNTQERAPQEDGPEVIREEGEIFALEQLLSEKQQLLNEMQKELAALAEIQETSFAELDGSFEDDDIDMEELQVREQVDDLERTIQEQRQFEEEQITLFEELSREGDKQVMLRPDTGVTSEDDVDPNYEELDRLLEKVSHENGDTPMEPKGGKVAYLKLQRALDDLERCQRLIINIDVFRQFRSNVIDSCVNPASADMDPTRTIDVVLGARTLQLLFEAGGTIPLQDLKDRISHEAAELGAAESLGVQAIYSLVASHLVQINRSVNPNLVSISFA